MKIEKDKSFGVIPVFKNENNEFVFCLVKHSAGHWGFPKGHANKSESEEETVKRELREETGVEEVDLSLNQSFFEEYSFEQDGVIHDKSVKYFLGFVSSIDATTLIEFQSEILELKWASYSEAKDLLTFREAKEFLEKAYQFLEDK